MTKYLPLSLALLTALPASAADWRGNMALEGLYFPDDALYPQQESGDASVSLEAEFFHELNDSVSLVVTPFVRAGSNDDERNHADLREAKLVFSKGDWDWQIGLTKVYWGVTETQHLVDIINQTDGVENLDGEDKLGQPAIQATWNRDWGTAEFFVLPGFRERTFAGAEGRLRSPLVVETDNPVYESSDEEQHVDYALRFSGTFYDVWDAGLSWFSGTSREPQLFVDSASGNPILRPRYNQIDQLGVDLQATLDSWLLKLEAINLQGEPEDYSALTTGFEYTLVGIAEGATDLGLLMEYHHDSRGENNVAMFQNDVFVGGRWTANDSQSTELLGGMFLDLDNSSRTLRLEASRRLGQDWKISTELQVFDNIDEDDLQYALRDDDFIRLELARYF